MRVGKVAATAVVALCAAALAAAKIGEAAAKIGKKEPVGMTAKAVAEGAVGEEWIAAVGENEVEKADVEGEAVMDVVVSVPKDVVGSFVHQRHL